MAAVALLCSVTTSPPARPKSEGAQVVQRCAAWAWPLSLGGEGLSLAAPCDFARDCRCARAPPRRALPRTFARESPRSGDEPREQVVQRCSHARHSPPAHPSFPQGVAVPCGSSAGGVHGWVAASHRAMAARSICSTRRMAAMAARGSGERDDTAL